MKNKMTGVKGPQTGHKPMVILKNIHKPLNLGKIIYSNNINIPYMKYHCFKDKNIWTRYNRAYCLFNSIFAMVLLPWLKLLIHNKLFVTIKKCTNWANAKPTSCLTLLYYIFWSFLLCTNNNSGFCLDDMIILTKYHQEQMPRWLQE